MNPSRDLKGIWPRRDLEQSNEILHYRRIPRSEGHHSHSWGTSLQTDLARADGIRPGKPHQGQPVCTSCRSLAQLHGTREYKHGGHWLLEHSPGFVLAWGRERRIFPGAGWLCLELKGSPRACQVPEQETTWDSWGLFHQAAALPLPPPTRKYHIYSNPRLTLSPHSTWGKSPSS